MIRPRADNITASASRKGIVRRRGARHEAPAACGLARNSHVGSGVVFDARRGLIITNSHVINHADDIKVRSPTAGHCRRGVSAPIPRPTWQSSRCARMA
jgi:S1-C subfamily serine protease